MWTAHQTVPVRDELANKTEHGPFAQSADAWRPLRFTSNFKAIYTMRQVLSVSGSFVSHNAVLNLEPSGPICWRPGIWLASGPLASEPYYTLYNTHCVLHNCLRVDWGCISPCYGAQLVNGFLGILYIANHFLEVHRLQSALPEVFLSWNSDQNF